MSAVGARVLVFCASGAVLMLEILAGRLMAPYVGVSLETFTAIIGVILAGIALGSAAGGRLADQHPPRRLIGPALVLGGGLAWFSLAVVAWVGPHLDNEPIAIVVLALLAFFAPAAVLSAVTPMATKLRLESLDQTGTIVGELSAAGTVGALFGTFVTGFVLIAALPTRPIVLALGAALVAAGLAMAFHFGRALPSAAAVVALVAAAGLGATANNPCEFESAYFCGRVVTDADDPSLKFLHLDTLRHGAVDLDDPTHLAFRYTRLFGAAIDAMPPGPIDAVHLGGGGFTMPQYVAATRPGSYNLVLEIDGKLLDVARDELGLVTGPRLEVEIGDGRFGFDDLESSAFDLVVGDAFSGLAVPWHLTTTEFIAEIDRVLTTEGIYVVNVLDGGRNRFAQWQVATLQEHFDHIEVIVPVDGIGRGSFNQIVIASDSPIARPTFDDADGVFVEDLEDYVGDGRVLRDDFAPVDQLVD